MVTTQRKNISTVEKFFVKTGKITAVRKWKGNNMYEIDIHLPNVDFEKWDKAQSIKCRISALHYTDYTPAMWNIKEKTCTMYIDTSHDGQGSLWAKKQIEGNLFHYLKIEAEKHFPIEGKHIVFLGDQTGIGHFCSLQQLATKNAKISGFITFNDLKTADVFYKNCPWLPLQAVSNYDTIYKQTEAWINQNLTEKDNFVFYVVGGAELIVALRKLLKNYGFNGSQIKSQGFWK
jgi:NADPH-dependent ferric siderophore reductase